jgi:hypothetical protein
MTTIPAFTISGITRPELLLDPNGNIVLTPAAQAFANQYGLKALYLGVPPGTPFPPVPGSPIPTPVHSVSTPVDINGAANAVLENAAVNTPVNITANSTSSAGAPIVYSLTADSSGGGFKIDPNTGVVSVSNSSKIDFESVLSHSYTITVQANDGIITSSQSFTIGVVNVMKRRRAPTQPSRPTRTPSASSPSPISAIATSKATRSPTSALTRCRAAG